MTKPRSDPRSGASSRPEQDPAALRRELYRPGADQEAVLAYLAAAEAEARRGAGDGDPGEAGAGSASTDAGADTSAHAVGSAAAAPAQPVLMDVAVAAEGAREADPDPNPQDRPRRPAHWRRIALIAALAVVVPAVGVALLPRSAPQPPPTPRPTATSRPVPVAPFTFQDLHGGDTLLVALPFRTNRVRVRLQCDGRAFYGWTALGQDAQTEQFVQVLSHSGSSCNPSSSWIGPLPGDVSALRILVVVEGGPYALTVEPL